MYILHDIGPFKTSQFCLLTEKRKKKKIVKTTQNRKSYQLSSFFCSQKSSLGVRKATNPLLLTAVLQKPVDAFVLCTFPQTLLQITLLYIIHSDLPCFVKLFSSWIFLYVWKLPIIRLEVYIPFKYCKASIFQSCDLCNITIC